MLFKWCCEKLFAFVSCSNTGTLSKLKNWIISEDVLHHGHIAIVHPDGSREAVKTNPQCLFHAIIEATTTNLNVVQEKALQLRKNVSKEVRPSVICYMFSEPC